ncbi:efflux RND transporter periplasmic adaptor subunit [Inhella sp.]|uniref:efflux RND transporter periplasmic adaptor subunit n=1 Tax=Inhella sp. TaxID=1921806 RepID=UPI0035B04B7A
MRRLAPLLLAVLGSALLAALLFGALRAGPLAPVRVTVAQAQQARIAPGLFGIGTVEARRSMLIGPTTPGRVKAVAVDVGELVKAGQLLAEMDPVDLDARLAALDAASARAASARQAAQAQQVDARARQALAAATLQRHAELAAQNFISPGALEARQQELASAQAAFSVAQANQAAARLEEQRLQAERAGLRLQRAQVQLRAPIDAMVVGRDAEPGSTLMAGQAVLRLIDPASLWVRLRLDQGRSAGLSAGLPAQIVLRSDPDHPRAGQVERVEALSDSVTEERVAQVRFEQLPATLSVGELAEVTLTLPPSAPAPTVPNAAIRRLQGRSGVWQVDAGGLRFQAVRLGPSSLDGRVQVLEGLATGATVVVHSEKALDARSRIRVVAALAGPQP